MVTLPVRIKDQPKIATLADTDTLVIDRAAGVKAVELGVLRTELAAAMVAAPDTHKLAPLGSDGRVPAARLPASLLGTLRYAGAAAGGSVPATSSATGDYLLISAAGTSQGQAWEVGDWAIYTGTAGQWDRYAAPEPRVVGDIRQYGAVVDGVTDDTAAVTAAKAAGPVVYFPEGTTYLAGNADLGGCTVEAHPDAVVSVQNTTGVEYRAWQLATDVTVQVRDKGNAVYTLPGNRRDLALLRRNVPRATYSTGAKLRFDTDWTAAELAYNGASPTAPAVAPTITQTTLTIETQSLAASVYTGAWIYPQVGRTIELGIYTPVGNVSGNGQVAVLNANGSEYVAIEVIDFENTLKSLTYEVNAIRMSGGTRARIERRAVRNSSWMIGNNGGARSVLVGVKLVAPDEAEFFVNRVLMFRLKLEAGDCSKIFAGLNGAYTGTASGLYDPVSYEDLEHSEQRKLRVAAFGDSLTWGSSTVLPWPELLPMFLEGASGVGAVQIAAADNYAYTGHTSTNQLATMQGVTLSDYQVVCIMVGTNDQAQNGSFATFESNLGAMIDLAVAAGCEVVVGIYPLFVSNPYDVRGMMRARLQRVALEKGARVADVCGLVGDLLDADTYMVGDLLHYKAVGHVMAAQAFAREIVMLYDREQPVRQASVSRRGNNIALWRASIPTSGYWRQDDVVYFTGQAAAGWHGARCVAAGTPGTWKRFGLIEA